jgi:TM2 domain-containing membrane protein YozV
MSDYSIKPYTTTLWLTIALGLLGIHRLYVGKMGTGILYFISGGFIGIGWIIDIFQVLTGNFTDKQGKFIRPNKNTRADRKQDSRIADKTEKFLDNQLEEDTKE